MDATGGMEGPAPAPDFGRRFFFWFVLFAVPAEIVAIALSVYVHEFAHGLTALALGGYFIGVKGCLFDPAQSVHAYADAWIGGDEWPVFIAGIAVNVTVGSFLLRAAFRSPGVFRRLVLFTIAGGFLNDWAYAFDGCVHQATDDSDTSVILRESDSTFVHAALPLASFAGWLVTTVLCAVGLFRTWERVFGVLTGRRAFWVYVLLICPMALPSFGEDRSRILLALHLGLFVVLGAGLVWNRRLDAAAENLEPLGGRMGALWAVGLLGALAIGLLERGIQLSTLPEVHVTELRAADRVLVGYSADYGLGDREGKERPAFRRRLFVSSPDGLQEVPAPPGLGIRDVAWVGARGMLVVVNDDGVYEVDDRSGQSRLLWEAEAIVRSGDHGPGGELVVTTDLIDLEGYPRPAIYVYDPIRGEGREYLLESAVGYPVFLPGSPCRALVSVQKDLWEVVWEPDGISVRLHPGASPGTWLSGVSRDQRWWSLEEGFGVKTDRASVDLEGALQWGAGPEGFYRQDSEGRWTLTTPAGEVSDRAEMTPDHVLKLAFVGPEPWVALREGVVRKLDDPASAYPVQLPKRWGAAPP